MKKFLYIAVIGIVIWSCGGGGDDPPPTPENGAPSTPSTVYPKNNELCIDNAVNFQWNASTDPDGDAITYTVQVSENSSFSSIAHTKTASTTSTSISLEKGVVFYWRVSAKDNAGLTSPPSSANQFYTEGEGIVNHLPFSPDLDTPALDETVSTATANLEWTASDVDTGDTLTFDVYLDSSNTPIDPTTIVAENHTTTNFTTGTLTASTTYYWKVVVKDDKGGETIGQVWNFKTD